MPIFRGKILKFPWFEEHLLYLTHNEPFALCVRLHPKAAVVQVLQQGSSQLSRVKPLCSVIFCISISPHGQKPLTTVSGQPHLPHMHTTSVAVSLFQQKADPSSTFLTFSKWSHHLIVFSHFPFFLHLFLLATVVHVFVSFLEKCWTAAHWHKRSSHKWNIL